MALGRLPSSVGVYNLRLFGRLAQWLARLVYTRFWHFFLIFPHCFPFEPNAFGPHFTEQFHSKKSFPL
jgi:hypothetical protein